MALLITLACLGMTAFSASAESIHCRWQSKRGVHPVGFWKVSEFSFNLYEDSAQFIRGDFFNRHYEPCYDGVSSSCTLDYQILPGTLFYLDRRSPRTYVMTQIHGDYLRFRMDFAADPSQSIGRRVGMILTSGGAYPAEINQEEFLCYVAVTVQK